MLAHGRQVRDDGNTHALQMRTVAQARELQELGREQAAAAHNHFLARADLALLPGLHHLHAHGAVAFEQNARGLHLALQLQVGALAQVRQYPGLARVVALAALHHDLRGAKAVLRGAVQVGVKGPARLLAGLAQRGVPGVVGAQLLHPHRAAVAVVGVAILIEGLVVLTLFEVGQHVVPAPAGVARRGPAVVVQRVAAHIHQHVERRAPAQAAPQRVVRHAPAQPRLRHSIEAPVVGAGLGAVQQRAQGRVAAGQPLALARPGFEQQHAVARVFRQARGDGAARRAGADDDEIHVHGFSCFHSCLRLMGKR